jgi:hypothetical protein
MGDYNRSTRELTLETLPAAMSAALKTHIEQYELGDVLADVLICVEATSEKVKKGLFAGPGPKVMKMGVVLTKRWLFEIRAADNEPPYARSLRLADIVVEDHEKSAFARMVPDTGVHITGQATGATESGTSFIGLGKDAAGEKFKEALIRAVQEAKK